MAVDIEKLKEFKGLVLRSEMVAYMEYESKYYRMRGFTDLVSSKEPEEYERKYVDEKSSRTATTGISASIEFTLDRYRDNPVHEKIKEVFDKEIIGDDATVNIIVVDFTQQKDDNAYAIKRNFTIVPDTEGDGTDAYTYSGTLKANGAIVEGYATKGSEADWLTCTFTEGELPKGEM